MNDENSAAAIAFMHPDDIGKLFVPSSEREPMPLVPEYSQDEDGVDTVKVLMATSNIVVFEAFRPKRGLSEAGPGEDEHRRRDVRR